MGKVTFTDNCSKMGAAYKARDFGPLGEELISRAKLNTYFSVVGDMFISYNVTVNKNLSRIYQDDFFVVKFDLVNVNSTHKDDQEAEIEKLFVSLKEYMESNPGYYNVRVPSHVVDIMRGFNSINGNAMFCGGTVEMIVTDNAPDVPVDFRNYSSKEYVVNHKDVILNIARKSFGEYQGQYHISSVTSYKAGEIYGNWLGDFLDGDLDGLFIADVEGKPAGFALFVEDSESVNTELIAVDESFRGHGIYRNMISYGINYAVNKGKIFINSTQLDNFIVQKTSAKLGMFPIYSIYNFHFDYRRKK